MSRNRDWMYRRLQGDGTWNPEFVTGLLGFIDYAVSRRDLMDGENIRCPCRRCDNMKFHPKETVQYHIGRNGFVRDYEIWRFHGEFETPRTVNHNFEEDVIDEEDNEPNYHTMVRDVAASQFYMDGIEEPPNPVAQHLYNMLDAADKELWPGCKSHSVLSFVARVMSLKAEGRQSEKNFDQWLELIKEILPDNDLIPKKMVTLFQCDWFDPSRLGTSVHPQFKLVSINHTRRYNKYEPFVLADQAIQVYYCTYPSTNRSKRDWWEACKIKARSKVEIPTVESNEGNIHHHHHQPQSSTGSDGGLGRSVAEIALTPSHSSDSVPATEASQIVTARTRIWIQNDKLYPLAQVAHSYRQIFKKVSNPTGWSWADTTDAVKDNYWNEFLKHFTCDEAIMPQVKELFFKKAKRMYSDLLFDIREMGVKPAYVHEDDWPKWQAYWNSDEFLAKSTVAKRNRMSEPEGPGTGQVKSRGGSRSIQEYADTLARQKGVEPSQCLFDAYTIIHVKKDGTYTDEKSRMIGERVKELADQMSQPLDGETEPREVDMNKIYMDVVGGLDKKKRMFGIGSLASSLRSEDSSGTSSYHSAPSIDPQRFQEMEEEMQARAVETQQLKDENKLLKERLDNQDRILQQILAAQGLSITQDTPPPS